VSDGDFDMSSVLISTKMAIAIYGRIKITYFEDVLVEMTGMDQQLIGALAGAICNVQPDWPFDVIREQLEVLLESEQANFKTDSSCDDYDEERSVAIIASISQDSSSGKFTPRIMETGDDYDLFRGIKNPRVAEEDYQEEQEYAKHKKQATLIPKPKEEKHKYNLPSEFVDDNFAMLMERVKKAAKEDDTFAKIDLSDEISGFENSQIITQDQANKLIGVLYSNSTFSIGNWNL
jgi:hypothetical protein